MSTNITEKGFETLITDYLVTKNGYEQGRSDDYDKQYAIDVNRVERFLRATQLEKVESVRCFASESEKRKFFTRLSNRVCKEGVINLLRKGFRYLTETFDLYFPLPSELNPTAKKMYDENIFCVTRQLYYSSTCKNSLDLMISLNGLPIITMELKNHYTGQTVDNAVRQYMTDRDPKDLLFQTGRCAVHFAVDEDEIMMCTSLKGAKSWFLPFNKGNNGGAGNPVNPNGMKTSYLWEKVLTKESLSDILENYCQMAKGKVIWPRFHQLDVVRKLLKVTRDNGVGHRYLIQHSAGSGKSNSITWLAYQLVQILDGNDALIDSVVVVTDRVNLDTQIRDNINSFKRLSNIVEWADSSSTLAKALDSGKKIIITTVHKFPFILEAIGSKLCHKRFGIIIDEAHSSQNGSLSAKMNIALAGKAGESDEEEELEDKLNNIIEGRKMVRNANYYAFTATPKNKTLEMFGTRVPGDEGNPNFVPFHEYTMKQAIEEHFIEDVLEHYTSYNSYYKVKKCVEDNPMFDKKRSQKKIRSFVESRPESIELKAKIIVDHFLTMVVGKGKIGGKARAMVVESSIDRAIKMHFSINELLERHGSSIRAIVAFSNKVINGKEWSESEVNGFSSAELPKKFREDPYRILVVANKYQTGFDEPLLHTMYVDKMLSGVKAVQTLSRLNRCHPLKNDTFILDFANDTKDIRDAFQKYYKKTFLTNETDSNKLNDYIDVVEDANLYYLEDVTRVNDLYWKCRPRVEFEPIIDEVVARFKRLGEDRQIRVKSAVKGFVRTYAFIAAITELKSIEWEMLNTFYYLLLHKLPILESEDLTRGLLNSIDLDRIQVAKVGERSIMLEDEDSGLDPIPLEGVSGVTNEPLVDSLSNILSEFNQINWKNEGVVNEQFMEMEEFISNDEAFVNTARNSDRQATMQLFQLLIGDFMKSLYEEHSELPMTYLKNHDFKTFINTRVFDSVYKKVRNK